MQAFERGDWLAAQLQQQVDSYSQSLACSLLAAGHKPPEWLLPSTTLHQGAPLLLPLSSRVGVRFRLFVSGAGWGLGWPIGADFDLDRDRVFRLVGLIVSCDLSLLYVAN
jgi:hypothetical protein